MVSDACVEVDVGVGADLEVFPYYDGVPDGGRARMKSSSLMLRADVGSDENVLGYRRFLDLLIRGHSCNGLDVYRISSSSWVKGL